MLSHITTVRWFDSRHSAWVTDYHNQDKDNTCIVSIRDVHNGDEPRYSFCMAKKLANDIHILLEEAVKNIQVHHNKSALIKIINLSLNCNTHYVTGRFSTRIRDIE